MQPASGVHPKSPPSRQLGTRADGVPIRLDVRSLLRSGHGGSDRWDYIRVSSVRRTRPGRWPRSARSRGPLPPGSAAAVRAERVELAKLLRQMAGDDAVKVASMDRLARSVVDLAQIVADLTGRGARVEFLADRLTFSPGIEDRATEREGVRPRPHVQATVAAHDRLNLRRWERRRGTPLRYPRPSGRAPHVRSCRGKKADASMPPRLLLHVDAIVARQPREPVRPSLSDGPQAPGTVAQVQLAPDERTDLLR